MSLKLARYECHKVVSAGMILMSDEDEGKLLVRQADGTTAEAEVMCGMFERYLPQIGDYYVVCEDGYAAISPKEAFENGYERVEADGAAAAG